jgi:hypothetical protein
MIVIFRYSVVIHIDSILTPPSSSKRESLIPQISSTGIILEVLSHAGESVGKLAEKRSTTNHRISTYTALIEIVGGPAVRI